MTFSEKPQMTYGTSAAPGRARGIAVWVRRSGHTSTTFPRGAIVVAEQTSPALTAFLLEASGLVLVRGGVLSHAASMCRCLGIPCIVGVSGTFAKNCDGVSIELDSERGVIRAVSGRAQRPCAPKDKRRDGDA